MLDLEFPSQEAPSQSTIGLKPNIELAYYFSKAQLWLDSGWDHVSEERLWSSEVILLWEELFYEDQYLSSKDKF